MTDKELLELAAKAAGIVGTWELDTAHVQERYYFNVPYDNHNMLTGFEWNPLREDGDALRLAVKLRLSVSHHNDSAQPHPWLRVEDRQLNWTHAGPSPEFNANPYAATRRAIVRAAAEIGKAMNA